MKDIVHVHVHEISGEINGYMSASLCQHQALDQLSVFCALIHWSEELSNEHSYRWNTEHQSQLLNRAEQKRVDS